MKNLILSLALMFAVISASSQSVYLKNGDSISVDLSLASAESVKSYVGFELVTEQYDIAMSDIIFSGGLRMEIFGGLVDSFFRPKLVWLDLPSDEMALRFPKAFGNDGRRVNVSYICENPMFQIQADAFFQKMKQIGKWEAVTKTIEMENGEPVTYATNVPAFGSFPTRDQFLVLALELSVWR